MSKKKNVNNSLLGSDIGTAFWGSTEPLCKLFSRQKYWGFWHFIHNLLELHHVKIRGWIVSYRLTCSTLSGASKETRFCCNLRILCRYRQWNVREWVVPTITYVHDIHQSKFYKTRKLEWAEKDSWEYTWARGAVQNYIIKGQMYQKKPY